MTFNATTQNIQHTDASDERGTINTIIRVIIIMHPESNRTRLLNLRIVLEKYVDGKKYIFL